LYAEWPVKRLFTSGRIKKKVVEDNTETSKAPQWGDPPVIMACTVVQAVVNATSKVMGKAKF